MRADFHVHTYASDGLFSPEEVVSCALVSGVQMLAVTDHDTTVNSRKVNTLCENAGIKPVNGVEISAYAGGVKIHTLGYGFDPADKNFQTFLHTLYEGSLIRSQYIIKKLNACGVPLTFEEAFAERKLHNIPLHVMHVARAAVRAGFAENPFTFYNQYLAPGAPAFCNDCRPTPEEAVKAITSAGGLAVIAHPGRVELEKEDLYALISRLAAVGLGGIEGVYSTHNNQQTAYFKEIAEEFNLLITGGSDTHYSGGSRRIGSPEFHPDEKLLQRMGI